MAVDVLIPQTDSGSWYATNVNKEFSIAFVATFAAVALDNTLVFLVLPAAEAVASSGCRPATHQCIQRNVLQ